MKYKSKGLYCKIDILKKWSVKKLVLSLRRWSEEQVQAVQEESEEEMWKYYKGRVSATSK